jgi:hypothetical protein
VAVVLLVLGIGVIAIVSYVMQAAEAIVAQTSALQNVPINNGASENGTANSGTGNSGAGNSGTDDVDSFPDPQGSSGEGGPKANESQDDYRQRVVRSVEQWRPALNRLGGTKSMKVRIEQVWLGNDPGRDAKGPGFLPAGEVGSRFLFIRIVIGNPLAEDLEYVGWNSNQLKDQAILIDDRDALCPLVPVDPEQSERLAGTRIPAKQSATDVLVFDAPQHTFEYVRLALPFTNGSHYGLQIDRTMLAPSGAP